MAPLLGSGQKLWLDPSRFGKADHSHVGLHHCWLVNKGTGSPGRGKAWSPLNLGKRGSPLHVTVGRIGAFIVAGQSVQFVITNRSESGVLLNHRPDDLVGGIQKGVLLHSW